MKQNNRNNYLSNKQIKIKELRKQHQDWIKRANNLWESKKTKAKQALKVDLSHLFNLKRVKIKQLKKLKNKKRKKV